MQFIVPQFIDKKTKILGPLGFTELIFVIIIGVICILLYYSIPFSYFVVASAFLIAATCALLFVKIEGFPLPTVMRNLMIYFINERIYLWKKKTVMSKIKIREDEPVSKEGDDGTDKRIKYTQKSRLKDLTTRIETRRGNKF